MVQVAVPELRAVALEHAVTPAVPLTDQETVPVGVVPPVGPATVDVKVTLLPSVVGLELVTTSEGVTLPTVKLLEFAVAVTPLIPLGVAMNVYVPPVLITRLENVATPLTNETGVVPEVRVVCVLVLVLMPMPTVPLAVVATLP